MKLLPIALLGTILFSPAAYAQATIQASESIIAQAASEQTIIVHLQHGTNDLHAVMMALKMANGLQKKGAKVILLLTQEGVRIADTRQPDNLRWGSSPMTVGQMYEEFVRQGGKVKVCPVCAEAAGLKADSLRQGAELAQGNQDIPSLVLGADKILDF